MYKNGTIPLDILWREIRFDMRFSFFESKKTIIILLLVIAVLVITIFTITRTDGGSAPEITSTEGNLKVSVKASEEELMKGIIATDKEDGDLTDKVLIESFSDFSQPGVRQAVYTVVDSDNNVSKYARNIEYTDYEPPVFSLDVNLICGKNDNLDIMEHIKAYDVLDGDITGKIRLLSSNIDTAVPGTYIAKYAVTNSAGDISEIELTVTVREDGRISSEDCIKLSEYVIYVPAGKNIDYKKYISSVVLPSSGRKTGTSSVTVHNPGSLKREGCYFADYEITENGVTDYARLTIVVR